MLQEVSRQQGDVLGAFPQCRQAQPDDVEPMEQVLAEQAIAYPLFEVLVGGGDDAHVGSDRLHAADTVEMAVGQHPQQTGLQLGRHVADLVEEQRAALGLLEAALPAGLRPREGPALVAEEFRLEQVARDRCSVDGDEGATGARTVAVQCACDQLFAAAGLAGDQHRGVRLRQPADGAEHLLHRGCLAEHLRHGCLWLLVLDVATALVERLADQLDRCVDVEGFGQILECAALKSRHRALKVREGGHDDDRHLWLFGADALEQVDAGDAGHADVAHNHPGWLAGEQRQRLGRRFEQAARDAFALQGLLEHPADRAVVIDDPDGLVRHGHWPPAGGWLNGNKTVKQVRPGALSQSIRPLCWWTKVCAIESPSPLPSSRPETSG